MNLPLCFGATGAEVTAAATINCAVADSGLPLRLPPIGEEPGLRTHRHSAAGHWRHHAPLISAEGRLINLSSSGHRFANVDLQDPNFERAEYHPWVASGRPKTANILFAVAFDHRHRSRGVRAAAVHPGDIQTKLGRHMDQVNFQAMIEQINKQLAEEGKGPFEWKTTPRGVRGYALHQSNAEALWKKSEELAGESF